MRAVAIGLCFGLLLAGSASAYDANDPKNCNGSAEWNEKRVLGVSTVTAKPNVYFAKSPYDDGFKAETCPAASAACRKTSYLVTGDLVLTGRTLGDFTCISYHSPLSNKRAWSVGWLPSAALAPVAPMPSPKPADWAGTWRQGNYTGSGVVEIAVREGGALHVNAAILLPPGRDAHNGAFEARVTPQGETLAFQDGGSNYGSGCQVRMQRIGPWLLLEDKGGCGGAGVTFTGLYRRTK